MPLPPRKFYTLQQAAEKLSRDLNEPVTIEDLIHYWSFDNLKLSIYFSDYPVNFNLGNLCFNKKDCLAEAKIFFENEEPEKFDFEFLSYSNSESKYIEEIEITDFLTQNLIIKEEKKKSFLRYSGLFQIESWLSVDDDINEIIKNGLPLSSMIFLISPNQYVDILKNQMVVQFINFLEERLYIDIRKLYILHYDLEQFINGNSRKINLEDFLAKPPRIDKQKNQANFIKALLQLHYNIEKPQDARNLLGSKGTLSKKFAKAGIECNISGKTLQNWLEAEF